MYHAIEQYIAAQLARRAPRLARLVVRHKIVIKYLFAGGTAVVVNILVLYLLTDVAGMWYVASSAIAFAASLATGFSLQKFWTFRDPSMRRVARQATLYTAVGVLNLILGPTILYAVVETFDIWYLAAQLAVLAVLAAESYFINRFITFRKDTSYESVDVEH